MTPLRILITAPTFPPCSDGVAHVTWEHASALVDRGHSVTVATQLRRDRVPSADSRISVVQFDVSGNANARTRYSGEIDRYVDFIGGFDCDLIACHCWQIWSTDLAARAFRRARAPKVLVSHGVSANTRVTWPRGIPSYVLWRPYVWWGMPSIMRSFDRILFLSEREDADRFYDRRLARRLGIESATVPNGCWPNLTPGRDERFRRRHRVTTRRLVLCVGKYDRMKNEEEAVRAFMDARVPDCTLVLIGPRENAYSNNLTNMWRPPTASTELRVLSGLEASEIREAYRAADLFVTFSRTEYLPLVILDAMASGVPFVSSDVGCVGDLPGGVVVRTSRELAARIRCLMSDDQLRARLSDLGRRACESVYSWDVVAKKLVAFYEESARAARTASSAVV
ncbi:glycosyltransferase family 4 protein [Anaeromyxobacter sp. SG17]|uniref:glycosyltransferase family 4 protein n=1 Tax=Anaeromyxobacter sp. SG17 TaxID=2925405 RepID=UPI0027DEAFBB|nr:glycosyltransferase family 4 protein [Anaeromyxobacter sp. SG17]